MIFQSQSRTRKIFRYLLVGLLLLCLEWSINKGLTQIAHAFGLN